MMVDDMTLVDDSEKALVVMVAIMNETMVIDKGQ